MEVANIRVREAFHRLRQFAAAGGHDQAGLIDVGLVLRGHGGAGAVGGGPQEDINVNAIRVQAQPQQAPRAPQHLHLHPHEVDIQLHVVREGEAGGAGAVGGAGVLGVQGGDNLIPVPTRTPKVPKTVLISGVVPIGTFSHVLISKVISPSMFWLKPLHSFEDLRTLERQMALFYEDLNSPFRDPSYFIEEGAYSGGYYAFYSKSQRCWVRAICGYDGVLVTKNTSVSMYLLDHGKVEHVPATSIRPLQSSFCKLPAQGLMAAFIGESGAGQGNAQDNHAHQSRWSPETCLALRRELQGRKLQVAVIRKCSIDFPSRFSRAEVVLKEQPNSSSV